MCPISSDELTDRWQAEGRRKRKAEQNPLPVLLRSCDSSIHALGPLGKLGFGHWCKCPRAHLFEPLLLICAAISGGDSPGYLAWGQGKGENRDSVLEPTVVGSRGPGSPVPKWNSICSRLDELVFRRATGDTAAFFSNDNTRTRGCADSPTTTFHCSLPSLRRLIQTTLLSPESSPRSLHIFVLLSLNP